MPGHKRLVVLQAIQTIGVIPTFYHDDKEVCLEVIKACINGGASSVEFLNRGSGAIDIFKALESFCQKHFPQAILGAGSIGDEVTAAMYINAGANFIVGPCLDEAVAKVCNKRKIAYLPGCGSLTEIHQAEALGVDICKIFPSDSLGGPNFIKAVLGPSPWSSLMPTGGVEPTKASLQQWFQAGAVCVGMGSKLISKDILNLRDFSALTIKIENIIKWIRQIREGG